MISFIVPAHNEARLIGATLDALHAVAGSLDEACKILVVDDASTDRTAAIARDRGVAVIRVEHRHIAATRNTGARHARGGRLFFVDADTVVDRTVVSAALAAMDAGAAGGGAAVRLRGPLAAHERGLQALSVLLFRATRIAPGCFVFCTRAAFDAAGGFDERYYAGEDVAISRALARHGRFVVLHEAVHTSARKLRTFSIAEQLRFLARFAVGGRRMLRSRNHLDFWYGKRRDEEY